MLDFEHMTNYSLILCLPYFYRPGLDSFCSIAVFVKESLADKVVSTKSMLIGAIASPTSIFILRACEREICSGEYSDLVFFGGAGNIETFCSVRLLAHRVEARKEQVLKLFFSNPNSNT